MKDERRLLSMLEYNKLSVNTVSYIPSLLLCRPNFLQLIRHPQNLLLEEQQCRDLMLMNGRRPNSRRLSR